MRDVDGTFPFGTPASRCAPRAPQGDAAAFVLGVYPSALHIRWEHPPYSVAALAVAPEPWPFWPGDDEAERVEQWRQDLSWDPAWGRARPAGRLNGSSGRWVAAQVLAPLRIRPQGVWFSDALPFFHVHRGKGTQGDAMTTRYDAFAAEVGLRPHRLPDRPSTTELVRRSITEEGDRLRGELERSGTRLLITLGNEALAVAAALVSGDLPARLSADAYGRRHEASTGSVSMEVLPLVHPGQRSADWRATHQRWAEQTVAG